MQKSQQKQTLQNYQNSEKVALLISKELWFIFLWKHLLIEESSGNQFSVKTLQKHIAKACCSIENYVKTPKSSLKYLNIENFVKTSIEESLIFPWKHNTFRIEKSREIIEALKISVKSSPVPNLLSHDRNDTKRRRTT